MVALTGMATYRPGSEGITAYRGDLGSEVKVLLEAEPQWFINAPSKKKSGRCAREGFHTSQGRRKEKKGLRGCVVS